MKFSKNTVAVLLLSLGMVGSVSAATFGAPVEATTTVDLQQDTVVANLLSPVVGIVGGNMGKDIVFANGTITITPMTKNFAMRFKTPFVDGHPDSGIAYSSDNPEHSVLLKLEPVNVTGKVGSGWLLVETPEPQSKLSYTIKNDYDKSVEPGHYEIITEAAIWTE
ncbi:hypothetical protein [Serratia odorifera]|uniref:hypothetical protein n=1 Tax=Serratia odorifera TaxID=618 RepID=UPI0018E90961|nr:hypothetical protein [Serratia odorifera]MBJ2066815.1 hypothetical protein [Serratia odorifera]